jgi:sulfopyruvate decarboxylase TPP-binding subunit
MKEIEMQSMLNAFTACSIDRILVVPSTGLGPVYAYYEKLDRCLYATREEEAVAIATGLTLGGEHPLLLIQQSGVGNALNAVFSLADAYGVFFPIVVCDRSERDPNPVQRVSSKNTKVVLDALGCVHVNWSMSSASETFKNCVKGHCRWITCAL